MKSRWIAGTAGRIDSRWHGEGPPILICHPHPKYGGTMGTRLVYLLSTTLAAAGHMAVRFDFRGAGRSEGQYDGGPGETEDALAVWDAIKAETGQDALVIGFSFGGCIALRVAGQRAVPGLVLIATPTEIRDSTMRPLEDAARVRCPSHVIIGTADELVDQAEAEAIRAVLGGRIAFLQGADHFLTPEHHDRAVRAVVAAVANLQVQ